VFAAAASKCRLVKYVFDHPGTVVSGCIEGHQRCQHYAEIDHDRIAVKDGENVRGCSNCDLNRLTAFSFGDMERSRCRVLRNWCKPCASEQGHVWSFDKEPVSCPRASCCRLTAQRLEGRKSLA